MAQWMDLQSDFRQVTFDKELARVLEQLGSKSVTLSGVTDDQNQFIFNVLLVSGDKLTVDAIAPVSRGLVVGEAVDIAFGLDDGQYLVKTKVESVDANGHPVLPLGKAVYRLQRRNNFRVRIPERSGVSFKLLSHGTRAFTRLNLKPLDLSAGGIRVRWQGHGTDQPDRPKVGDQIGCLLGLPGGKQLELFGTIRVVYKIDRDDVAAADDGSRSGDGGGDLEAGIEFQNLSVRDEQTLLFACLQLQRISA